MSEPGSTGAIWTSRGGGPSRPGANRTQEVAASSLASRTSLAASPQMPARVGAIDLLVSSREVG